MRVPFLDNTFFVLEQVGGLYDVEAARQGEGWTICSCMLEVEASWTCLSQLVHSLSYLTVKCCHPLQMLSVMVLFAGARHLDWELACKLWPFWWVLFWRWAPGGQPGQRDQQSSCQIMSETASNLHFRWVVRHCSSLNRAK